MCIVFEKRPTLFCLLPLWLDVDMSSECHCRASSKFCFFYHGGLFVRTPKLVYMEEGMSSCYADPDMLNVRWFKECSSWMGYAEYRIRKLHLRIPNVAFDESLLPPNCLIFVPWTLSTWDIYNDTNRPGYFFYYIIWHFFLFLIPIPQAKVTLLICGHILCTSQARINDASTWINCCLHHIEIAKNTNINR